MPPAADSYRLSVVVPRSLADRMREVAQAEHRSLSSQCVVAIERFADEHCAASQPLVVSGTSPS